MGPEPNPELSHTPWTGGSAGPIPMQTCLLSGLQHSPATPYLSANWWRHSSWRAHDIVPWASRALRSIIYVPFGGLLGAVRGHIVELEGPRGPFGTGKSSCMCRVATISLRLAVFSTFYGGFGQKKADFGPKLEILKWRSSTRDTCSRPPPLRF